ncbi:cysteine dioxygenase [Actinomadura sp. HBU206391]|uniref:cysteine dioxygenase n=1 Tax=Actinomadura sp. HBU206391 TaxID=2731692 RepID=UPI00165064EE|nr:cysteine dioxygenase [Actinomadura sp. HBU206391]MBC6456952.1 cysteine dioxygenase [Actinomadura sp. HBU206391]
MDLDLIPDITMHGQDDPHQRVITKRPPTVGRLAALIHEHMARPADWWHLVRFDAAQPVRTRLDGTEDIELWLTVWPPGHRTHLHDHDATPVAMLVAGELTEVAISPDGATERPLRINRARVFARKAPSGSPGEGRLHELANPGPTYAITLHALPARGPHAAR